MVAREPEIGTESRSMGRLEVALAWIAVMLLVCIIAFVIGAAVAT
jgi:hypothetical protein